MKLIDNEDLLILILENIGHYKNRFLLEYRTK